MASNASTRLNALGSGKNVQSETVESDIEVPIVGADKDAMAGGFGCGLGGMLFGVAADSGPVGWCVGASAAVVGATIGAI